MKIKKKLIIWFHIKLLKTIVNISKKTFDFNLKTMLGIFLKYFLIILFERVIKTN